MNKKRLVALLAAVVMILGTVPVFAAETTGSGTVVETATDGALNITGDATVNDVAKPDTFVVTLPTAKAFDFYVDPYGLVDAATGTAVDIVSDATGQGAIIVKDDALAVIKNQSNVDVVVDVTIQIEATGGALNLVTDQATVATGTATNMFIGLVPGTDKAYDADSYVATGEAIAIEEGGTEVSFLLNKAVYEVYVKDDGSLGYQISGEADNFDAVAFKLGGSINKAADWSVFTAANNGSITFDVVFDIAKATDEVAATDTALYGVVSGTAVVDYTAVAGTNNNQVEYVDGTWSYSTSTLKYTLKSDGNNIAGSDVEKVEIEGVDAEITFAGTTNLTVAKTQVTNNSEYTNTSEDLVFIVTMSDGTVYRVVKA